MAEKHKKTVQTIKQKLQLTEKLKKGDLPTKLAKDYCTGVQTVLDINKNKTKLVVFAKNCNSCAASSKQKKVLLSGCQVTHVKQVSNI
jgi:ribosomal protein L30E